MLPTSQETRKKWRSGPNLLGRAHKILKGIFKVLYINHISWPIQLYENHKQQNNNCVYKSCKSGTHVIQSWSRSLWNKQMNSFFLPRTPTVFHGLVIIHDIILVEGKASDGIELIEFLGQHCSQWYPVTDAMVLIILAEMSSMQW